MKKCKVILFLFLLIIFTMLMSKALHLGRSEVLDISLKDFDLSSGMLDITETAQSIYDIRQKEAALGRELLSINQDAFGWLQIPDTNVDYPVVQTDNNASYLTRDFYGDHNSAGTLFVDWEDDLTKDQCKNLIVYGHHMKNGGMFGSLPLYKDETYCREHGKIFFYIVEDKVYTFEIISVFITEAYPSEGEPDYRQIYFDSTGEYEVWLSYFKNRSLVDTGVEIDGLKRTLTLSTCSYEFKNARMVIMALETDENSQLDY